MRVSVRIDAIDDEGAGVGAAAGRRVHVAGAVPGDAVAAQIVHRSPHRPDDFARLVRVEDPSPDRVATRCPHFGDCGGCPLMPLAYAAQLRAKEARVRDALARAGVAAPVMPIVPAPSEWGYRATQKYVAVRRGGRTVLGSYRPRSHAVADMSGCLVARPEIEGAADAIARLLDEHRLRPRHVVVRDLDGALAVTIVDRAESPGHAAFAQALRAARPGVAAVVLSRNEDPGNRILGARDRVLEGAEMGSPRVFRQPNPAQAGRLYDEIASVAALTGREIVFDLYSGAGAIARALAPRAARAIAVDLRPAPVSVPRVETVAGDVAEFLRGAPPADLVVVNPPRRGVGGAVAEWLGRSSTPRIFYVSCSPESLARDLARVGAGCEIGRVTPYDMLPQTPHVEILAEMGRR